ncbi:LOW QUALITY PROTEIN: forkhead box protein R1-like [Mus caroli]|uniref:LOW QUALITY PROTEIN: forkhead box protein R1-like n=1 Tax=Mus caroli TaxID=10089 RepID=A0A6P5QF36_MUSCR|nr:LOW QUALITY PROTEIN: forkhead box protein R1-like [Mus caroli]
MDPQAIVSVCRGAVLLTAPTCDCPRFEEAPSMQASLSVSCTPHNSPPLALKVDPKFQDRNFWASLHGQVPGLLDWDMGNECFLTFTTTHLSEAEQKLALYRLQLVEPPKLPLEKKPNPDKDGPDIEPNLWMWVNPNIVYPPGKLEVAVKKEDQSALPAFQPALKEEEDSCSEASGTAAIASLQAEEEAEEKHIASSPSTWEEPTEEEEAKAHDDSSSLALPSLPTRAPLENPWRLPQAISPEGRLWSRPPLHYFHLIALALRNSPPCGLNVQQIYSFTREHFPFFRTAPEAWKNTVRHNLSFRDSFQKVPASQQGVEASTGPRSCLWKLTEEGHRRFSKEARTLASTQLQSIQQCMSQPDVMPFLFDLQDESSMPY